MKKTKTPVPSPGLVHIAEAVKKYIKDERITMQELGVRAGLPAKNKTSVVRGWALGRFAPTTAYRAGLARILNVDPEFLQRRPQAIGPARRALVLASIKEPVVVASDPIDYKLLRVFEEHGDGTATVKLNARIPLAEAKKLFAVLMEVALSAPPESTRGGSGN